MLAQLEIRAATSSANSAPKQLRFSSGRPPASLRNNQKPPSLKVAAACVPFISARSDRFLLNHGGRGHSDTHGVPKLNVLAVDHRLQPLEFTFEPADRRVEALQKLG